MFHLKYICLCNVKRCTYIPHNLLAINSRLDVRIACDGLQQKFQHAEHFTHAPTSHLLAMSVMGKRLNPFDPGPLGGMIEGSLGVM